MLVRDGARHIDVDPDPVNQVGVCLVLVEAGSVVVLVLVHDDVHLVDVDPDPVNQVGVCHVLVGPGSVVVLVLVHDGARLADDNPGPILRLSVAAGDPLEHGLSIRPLVRDLEVHVGVIL